MTRVALGPDAARTVLGSVIRDQLRQAWERGMDTAPHGPHATTDRGMSMAFSAIMDAVDDLTAAVANVWRTTGCPVTPATDNSHGPAAHVPGTAIDYRLTCGCNDWCNCQPCLDGTPHEEGASWTCDEHGPTSVAWQSVQSVPVTEARDGALAVIHSVEAFTLAPGHRMRAAKCLVCRLVIGAGEAALVGVAPLAGSACRCGGVVSDVYLIHAVHIPMGPDDLAAAINRGLACPVCNSAS